MTVVPYGFGDLQWEDFVYIEQVGSGKTKCPENAVQNTGNDME